MSADLIVEPTQRPVRVRIAPSPTGDPHVGTAYMALFNLAFARKHGGQFVLRIEDTDQARYIEGSQEQVFSALRWLGLVWDEGPDVGGPHGPYRQSERLPSYAAQAQRLLDDGHAYHCWCSAERLAEMRSQQQKYKQPTGYDRLCYGLSEVERAKLPGFSATPVVRMYVPADAPTSFEDLVRGHTKAPHPDDQVILKADGFPTYHLAVVVDDHEMAITHVVRGEEWISSTPKHLLLYTWLGWTAPQFAHMPLLRNTDRSKISKRKNPAARLLWFQEQGFLPQALVNFLALMGYSMPDGQEVFTVDELTKTFDFDRVDPVGPVFDIDKLTWLNGHYLRGLSDAGFLAVAEPFLPDGVDGAAIAPVLTALRERTKRLAELPAQLTWLSSDPPTPTAAALTAKGLASEVLPETLEAIADALTALEPFEPSTIETALDDVVTKRELNRRRAFMSTRVAVVGGPVSPPLHETITALGRERTVARLRAAATAGRVTGASE